jgi:hypothetical protein
MCSSIRPKKGEILLPSWEVVGLIDTEGARADWTFPAEPGAVRRARHAVRDTLRAWSIPPAVGDVAELLVSELVTNSMRYASGPIGLRMAVPAPSPAQVPGSTEGATATADQAVLLVEVSDPLTDAPTERRTAGPEDEGGRGLLLVASSARRWGTRRGKTGKTVWFELPLLG